MANDLNSVQQIGRATRDLELKYTQGGLAIGNFAIAVNKSYKGKDGNVKEETSFFEVSLFGKIAETMKQYVTKGKQVCIKGELKQDRWEQDGQTKSKVVIVAEHIQLLGGHANQDSGSQGDRQPQTQQTTTVINSLDGFPDDCPF